MADSNSGSGPRSITDIPVPEDAPGPSDEIVADRHKDRMVIHSQGDAGWEARVEIDLESQWAFINIHDAR